MSKKWKVYSSDTVYGHYTGKTPEEAANKARLKNYIYHPELEENFTVSVVKCGYGQKSVEVAL